MRCLKCSLSSPGKIPPVSVVGCGNTISSPFELQGESEEAFNSTGGSRTDHQMFQLDVLFACLVVTVQGHDVYHNDTALSHMVGWVSATKIRAALSDFCIAAS